MAILSIQSHVAYGHVGNAAAVFALQRLGLEVWPVHSVQFSNHPGYGDWAGDILPAEHVRRVIDGIAARGVLGACDAVLSGYLGDAGLGEAVLVAVRQARAANPAALYACDPVMGDTAGGLFVRENIPAFLRERAVPLADIITPNAFELEQLTGLRIASLDDAIGAARQALALGPSIVLVTSLRHDATPDGAIEMLAVTPEALWRVRTPFLKLDPAPNGAGDALAALFLAHYLSGRDAARALATAAAAIFAVVAATQAAGTRELQLIAAQDELVRPARRFKAERLGNYLIERELGAG
ncbi:MAG: pyridoxal kinase PdxY, partial [Kiloniellaceae bacterium]